MGVLSGLQPRRVFEIFEMLSSVPHGSGNTGAVSALCENFAAERGLRRVRDGLGNVVIYKPASPGREGEPAVVLQAHLDMVCASRPEDGIDMSREPVRLATDGISVRAEGTSLGGDDGIGVAVALAVLDEPSLSHPALEVLLTVDEETGMYGAAGLDPSLISGRRLLNLDSEADGVFTVGCAGGIHIDCSVPLVRGPLPEGYGLFGLAVSGLLGGHSGCEIDKGRGNAAKLAARALYELGGVADVRLVSLDSGRFSNVIPSRADAVFAAPAAAAGILSEAAARTAGDFAAEYAVTDPGVELTLGPASGARFGPAGRESTDRVLGLMISLPDGVGSMSPDFPGIPETSLSMGIAGTGEDSFGFCEFIRSSSPTRMKALADRICVTVSAFGGRAVPGDSFPGWEYRRGSGMLAALTDVYVRLRGSEPRVEITHGGLEVGLLASKLPGLDAVSVGPDLSGIHSVDEKADVASVGRLYGLVLAFLGGAGTGRP